MSCLQLPFFLEIISRGNKTSGMCCACMCVFTQLQHTGPALHLCGPVSISIFVQFFLPLLYILCQYHLFLQYIPIIYTSLGKTVLFCHSGKSLYAIFFLCPLKFPAFPFLSVSSRLFVNLYIIIKSSLFLQVCCNAFLLIFSYMLNLSTMTPSQLLFSVFVLISTHAFSCEGTRLLLHNP